MKGRDMVDPNNAFQGEAKTVRVSAAVSRALKASREVRNLLREDAPGDLHAALKKGLSAGPLVLH